jgi:hypothetical protein
MVRQAHHLTTLSQVEGQIAMTEIQNPKQLVLDLMGIVLSSAILLGFADNTKMADK